MNLEQLSAEEYARRLQEQLDQEDRDELSRQAQEQQEELAINSHHIQEYNAVGGGDSGIAIHTALSKVVLTEEAITALNKVRSFIIEQKAYKKLGFGSERGSNLHNEIAVDSHLSGQLLLIDLILTSVQKG